MEKYRIGHSGITWGYDLAKVEEAIKDVSELGYSAFETFGRFIPQYDAENPEGFAGLLKRYDIGMSAAYATARFHNPTHGGEVVKEIVGYAQQAAEVGATTLVLAAGSNEGRPYTHENQWAGMAARFNRIAAGAAEAGMITALHPHTGTLVETRAEIDAIMAATDPALVGFAPDTGQIQKGGADMLATLEAHKDRIWHVHLKDYAGGRETGYVGYEAIGQGVLDIAGIFRILDEINFDKWISVELDGTPESPRPPREAAAMSRAYLEELLGDRVAWRS